MTTTEALSFNPITEDKYYTMSKMDTKNIFSEHIDTLKMYMDTVKIHQKHRNLDKKDSEYDEYQALYDEINTHFNYIYDYIMHFDYYSYTNYDRTAAKKTIHKHLVAMDALLSKLHDLDMAYQLVEKSATNNSFNLSFWYETPYFMREVKKHWSTTKRNIAIASGAAILAISFIAFFSKYSISNTQDGLAIKPKLTLADWFYSIHENIEPTSTNVIHLDEHDCDIILGKTTLADLQDSGYEYGYEEYTTTSVVDGDTYNIIHHQFFYSYNEDDMNKYIDGTVINPIKDRLTYDSMIKIQNIYPYGTGTVELHNENGMATKVRFETFQNCDAQHLDLSKCYVSMVEFRFIPEIETSSDFEFMGFDSHLSVDALTEKYGDYSITNYYALDDDKDGTLDSETTYYYLSRHEQLSVYHNFKADEQDYDYYILNISTEKHNLAR